ncbi:hypothetical protein Tco_0870309, partial [Tanacetum coccineum]
QIEPMDSEHGSEKIKSPEKIEEEDVDTQEEMKEVVKETREKRKKSIPRKSTRKRQKMEKDAEKEELKRFLDIIPREEVPIDVESLYKKFPVVDWKTCVLTENFMYYQVFRGDGSSKNYKVLSEMLEDFDRQDVEELYRLVKEKYSASRLEGFDLMLWGDLYTIFESDEEDEIWKNQHEYNLISWRLCDFYGIHILLMESRLAIHMLIEKKYPLSQELLSKITNEIYLGVDLEPDESKVNTASTEIKQLHDDDLEEMDLKWNMALLSMRARKFYQRTRRKIIIDGSRNAEHLGVKTTEIGIKVDSSKAVRIKDASEKAMCAIDGAGFDWSDMAEEEIQANMALMAITYLHVSNRNNLVLNRENTDDSLKTTNKRTDSSSVNLHLRSVNTGRPFSTARSFNTVRPSYTAHPKSTVHCARPRTYFQNQAQSTVQRPVYKKTSLTKRSYNQNVNTDRARGFNDVKPSAYFKDFGMEYDVTYGGVANGKRRITGKVKKSYPLQALTTKLLSILEHKDVLHSFEILSHDTLITVQDVDDSSKKKEREDGEVERRRPSICEIGLGASEVDGVSGNDDEDIVDDSSKQGRKLSDAEVQEKASTKTEPFIHEVTPTEVIQDQENSKKGSAEVSTAGAIKEKRTRQDKGKAIMLEYEPKKKSKKEIEQERLSFAEAIRLEEQMNEEQRAQIARDEEIARQGKKRKTKSYIEEEDVATQKEMKEVSKESGAKRKKSIPRKSTRKRQKDGEDSGRQNSGGGNFMYYQVFRGDDSSKNYKVLSEMLKDFDRQDVEELYRLVKERYSASRPEGYDLMLWGDLHTLFEPDEEDELWKSQHEYNVISWSLYDFYGIHILLMQNGIAIHRGGNF